MKYSNIGGQAVMEGIMMKNGDHYAVAVRKPDKEIEVKVEECHSFIKNKKILQLPFIRGVFNFVDSLVLGMKSLMFSAEFFMDDEEEEKEREKEEKQRKKGKDPEKENSILLGFTVAFSIVLAVGVFMILPYFISLLFQKLTDSQLLISIAEGVVRILIFVGYILLISRMKDIQRTFMYHGAEHKCINCIEHGLDLNVENVRKSSREHKRCGTSFLVFVVVISIILYLFIRVDSHTMRIVIRLLLIPVIAGISYELLRAAGRTENRLIKILSKPGLWMQRLTVREPDDEMIEVGIASVEAVFDWRSFVQEVRKEQGQEPDDDVS